MTFGAIGGAILPAVGGAIGGKIVGGLFGDGGGGGGGGGGQPMYTPQGLSAADTGWQQGYFNQLNNNQAAQNAISPGALATFNANANTSFAPLWNAANQAGAQYGHLGDMASYHAGQMENAGRLAQGQQQNLYNAGANTYQTALDPQNDLYNRTQGQLQNQVRAGQAARGLGNSAYGAGLEDQAMGNFNIDWRNQQLARQIAGSQAQNAASAAGAQQGQLQGANTAAAMQLAGQQPGFTMQSAQQPLQTQQYINQQPAQNAAQYAQNLGQINTMHGNTGQQAIPYMNYGQGAQSQAQNFNAAQNQGMYNMGSQIGTGVGQALGNSYNTPGSWLSNLPGGGSGGYNSQHGGFDAGSNTYNYSPYVNV